jgi:CRP-like cAMP-binding protein
MSARDAISADAHNARRAAMATEDTAQLLSQQEFFQGADERYVQSLAKMCRVVEFPVRTKIFEEFDRAKETYFILDGQISIGICDSKGCRQIAVIGKGDLLGWSPLVGRSRLFDTARTTSQVRALEFDGKELIEFCEQHPQFGFDFMRRAARVLADRLSAARVQMLELGGVHLPEFQLESD